MRKPIIVWHFKWNWIGYFGPLHRNGYQERITWTFPISWNAIITYALLTKREAKMTRYWSSSHGPWIDFVSVHKDAKMAHISCHLDRTSLVKISHLNKNREWSFYFRALGKRTSCESASSKFIGQIENKSDLKMFQWW